MIVTVYTCIYHADYDIYFGYANRVGEGTVTLVIVVFIHRIPVYTFLYCVSYVMYLFALVFASF
jgi:hypothetical protein